MNLHTASEVISFTKKLENESAKFYEGLVERYSKDKGVFLAFAEDNIKNIAQIERAYYGVITDAIEGCFAFDIEPDEYMLCTELADNTSYSDALNKAEEIEQKILNFYSDAAEQSKSLMADVPRNFTIVARRRSNRIPKLKSLVEKEGQ